MKEKEVKDTHDAETLGSVGPYVKVTWNDAASSWKQYRINAENPSLDFQPSPGTISVCHQPSGFRTRVDGSIFQGCKITPYYDSLIAKVICKGRNRSEAIQRTLRSLDEFVLEGITTTIDLHKKILNHKKFISSDFDVNWLMKESFY